MSDLVQQYVFHLAQTFSAGSAQNFVASVPLDASHNFYAPLRQALNLIPDAQLSTGNVLPQCGSISASVREIFASFVVALLKHIGGGMELDPSKQAWGAFSRLQQVYSEANRLYAAPSYEGPNHPFLNPSILALARLLVRLSREASAVSTDPPKNARSARSIRDLTRQTIERSFQIASANVSQAEWDASAGQECVVGDLVWPLGNVLFRIYAERRLHSQASDLCRTLGSLSPSEERRTESRPGAVRATDLCQSYYWRGKTFLVLLEFRQAKVWLDRAMAVCPEEARRQRRAILIRLIAASLLAGFLPSEQLLRQYRLPEYLPLITAFRTGNVPAWRKELDENREWYRSRHVWLLLYERGEILVWRNLFRQSLKAYYVANPDASNNRCPTRVFVAATQSVFAGTGEVEDGTIAIEDIICVISSLIDHGLILGFLSYSQQTLIMKTAADGFGGFPKISQVMPRAIQANT